MTDPTALDDTDLAALWGRVQSEVQRRATLTTAAAEADALNTRYVTAIGRADGAAWVQPTGAHDAYPANSTVTHGGKTWETLTPANVWQPPTNWREVVTGGGAPAWVQPTGATDAYAKGAKVTFEGKVWESVIAANTWSPTAYPAGWKVVV